MNDLADIRRGDTRLLAHLLRAIYNGLFGGCIGGQHLGRVSPTAKFQHNIRKSAADIDAQTVGSIAHVDWPFL